MLGNICLLLGLSFMWFGVIVPLHRKTQRVRQRRSRDAMMTAQALAVRSFYPGLEKLTPRELRRRYNVESAYNRIGRY